MISQLHTTSRVGVRPSTEAKSLQTLGLKLHSYAESIQEPGLQHQCKDTEAAVFYYVATRSLKVAEESRIKVVSYRDVVKQSNRAS